MVNRVFPFNSKTDEVKDSFKYKEICFFIIFTMICIYSYNFIEPYFQFVNIYVTLRLLICPKRGLTTKQWKASLTPKSKTLKSYFSVVISVFRESQRGLRSSRHFVTVQHLNIFTLTHNLFKMMYSMTHFYMQKC